MSSSASASAAAVWGSTSGGGGQTSATVAAMAPLIEPPASFGIVAPGIYRCSVLSLTLGLPAAPFKAWKARAGAGAATTSAGNAGNQGSTSGSSNNHASTAAGAASMTPTESFLSSLQLRTILLLAPEKKPAQLASWCASRNIELVHLGLGALADLGETGGEEGNSARERMHPSLSLKKSFETYTSLPDSGILSLERIVKDSLEILLRQARLPCLVCDTSGVNETGVVVGCLRRMQRRSFASIRVEYRAFAGSRSRSSHERFIEMFDPDLISLPTRDKVPPWFAQQQMDDDAEEAELIASK